MNPLYQVLAFEVVANDPYTPKNQAELAEFMKRLAQDQPNSPLYQRLLKYPLYQTNYQVVQGQPGIFDFDLVKEAREVIAFNLSADKMLHLYTSATLGLVVGAQEIYPPGHSARLLTVAPATSANDKFCTLPNACPVGNGQLRLAYQDNVAPDPPRVKANVNDPDPDPLRPMYNVYLTVAYNR